MKVLKFQKAISKISFFLVLILCTQDLFAAQETENLSETEESVPSLEERESNAGPDVERLSVVGQKPLQFYRNEYTKAEIAFVDVFNSINTKKKFAIKCDKFSDTGTRIKTIQRCEPEFVREIRRERSRQEVDPNYIANERTFVAGQKEQVAHVQQLAEENPKLRDALIAYHNAKVKFEEQKKLNQEEQD